MKRWSEIVTSIRKVADIVSDIAVASKEQAGGIDEVSTAVTNMDEMTQQNAALVEETTAALQSAQDQAGTLGELVQFFHTDGAAAPAPAKIGPVALPTGCGEQPVKVRSLANPVHARQQILAKKVAAGGAGSAAAADDDDGWQEF